MHITVVTEGKWKRWKGRNENPDDKSSKSDRAKKPDLVCEAMIYPPSFLGLNASSEIKDKTDP